MVRIWVRHCNEECENVHDDLRSGRPSVVNEDLVHAVEEKIQENRWFSISSLSLHFPQISPSLLHEIVSDKLCFRKLCSRWVPKMLTDEHKMKWHSSLTFLTQYSEQGDDFLSHIVIGDETWVLHITPESKQQSMELRHTSSPIKRNSNRPCQLVRSCAQCFGTETAFCSWNSRPKAQKSTQVSTATHLRNCVVRSRTSNVACLVRVLWCFMTIPAHTLPPQRKILWHLVGNNLIIPPTVQT
jgi:hypothetical protein